MMLCFVRYCLLRFLHPLLLVGFLLPAVVQAMGPIQTMTPGFAGSAGLLLIGTQRKSNLDTEQASSLDSLSTSSTTEAGTLVAPAFELSYSLANERTQFYAGTQTERILDVTFALEVGLRQRLGEGFMLRMGYLPAVLDTEQWSDPYLVAQPRSVSNQSSSGILLGLDHLAFSLNYAQASVKLDDEQSGSALDAVAQNALRRDGDYQALVLDVGFPLKKNLLILPSLQHVQGDLDGAALSHSQTTFNMGLMFQLVESRVIVSVGGGRRSYDEQNPVFGEKQRDALLNATVLYLRNTTLWGAPALTTLISYQSSDANIDFYDDSGVTALMGFNWSF